jgi:hypothetical protein
MLDKKGNSNYAERIELLEEFRAIFPEVKVDCLTGDRELVGEKWFNYLLDDKSNGFNLESSGLRNVAALSRLCLVMTVATLFLTAQGVEVVVMENRRKVDPHWFREAS